jgi:hypothetical protein
MEARLLSLFQIVVNLFFHAKNLVWVNRSGDVLAVSGVVGPPGSNHPTHLPDIL